jgi:hypothetical protein
VRIEGPIDDGSIERGRSTALLFTASDMSTSSWKGLRRLRRSVAP